MQGLVDRVYPGLKARMALEKRKFCEEQDIIIDDEQESSTATLKRKGAPGGDTDDRSTKQKQSANENSGRASQEDAVTFALLPRNGDASQTEPLPSLQCPFLTTSARITIGQLRKHLNSKLGSDQVEIVCGGVVLGGEYTLEYVLRTLWRGREESLELEYGRPALAYRYW
mmetsp:Transcript_41268/g.68883  ORF Transcript_41268/g.68883 Transcript_41268/m.68883 type:complete len:170 (-) Transcript_41268:398-907(-)